MVLLPQKATVKNKHFTDHIVRPPAEVLSQQMSIDLRCCKVWVAVGRGWADDDENGAAAREGRSSVPKLGATWRPDYIGTRTSQLLSERFGPRDRLGI
jgi:hypothetical protein